MYFTVLQKCGHSNAAEQPATHQPQSYYILRLPIFFCPIRHFRWENKTILFWTQIIFIHELVGKNFNRKFYELYWSISCRLGFSFPLKRIYYCTRLELSEIVLFCVRNTARETKSLRFFVNCMRKVVNLRSTPRSYIYEPTVTKNLLSSRWASQSIVTFSHW